MGIPAPRILKVLRSCLIFGGEVLTVLSPHTQMRLESWHTWSYPISRMDFGASDLPCPSGFNGVTLSLTCRNWIRYLRTWKTKEELVTLTLVTDASYFEQSSENGFDVSTFKQHYLLKILSEFLHISSIILRNALRQRQVWMLKRVTPHLFLRNGSVLCRLIQRHRIRGIATFSRLSFENISRFPAFWIKASRQHETIGIILWFNTRGRLYHLGAYRDRNRPASLHFRLLWVLRLKATIAYFWEGVQDQ